MFLALPHEDYFSWPSVLFYAFYFVHTRDLGPCARMRMLFLFDASGMRWDRVGWIYTTDEVKMGGARFNSRLRFPYMLHERGGGEVLVRTTEMNGMMTNVSRTSPRFTWPQQGRSSPVKAPS